MCLYVCLFVNAQQRNEIFVYIVSELVACVWAQAQQKQIINVSSRGRGREWASVQRVQIVNKKKIVPKHRSAFGEVNKETVSSMCMCIPMCVCNACVCANWVHTNYTLFECIHHHTHNIWIHVLEWQRQQYDIYAMDNSLINSWLKLPTSESVAIRLASKHNTFPLNWCLRDDTWINPANGW